MEYRDIFFIFERKQVANRLVNCAFKHRSTKFRHFDNR